MLKKRLLLRLATLALPVLLSAVLVYSLGFAGLPAVNGPVVAVTRAAIGQNGQLADAANTRQVIGVGQQCRLCHQKAAASDPIPGFPDVAVDGWVLLNEVTIWATKDKHYQAYAVLLNARSQQMARIMKVVDNNGESQIHRDKRCLACHSGIPVHQLESDNRGLVPVELTNDFRLTAGVSCEGCHGPAGKGEGGVEGWLSIHYNKDKWRFMSPKQKWEVHGYVDVRSPVAKTRMCLSCHLGNAHEGKVITHEMYAAGHPPLPGFEVESFIDQEPQHWRNFGDKSEKIRQAFLEKTKSAYDSAHLHRTKSLLVGAVVNLSEMLKLSADIADADLKTSVARPEWPELANFACYACHHDLKAPAWRQDRQLYGMPGRPLLHEWTSALLEVVVDTAGITEDELNKHMSAVPQALNTVPFGAPKDLVPAARATADWLDDIARKLEHRDFTAADGRKILQGIVNIAISENLDYDSARQLVWAFSAVYSELNHSGISAKPGELTGWYEDGTGKPKAGLDQIETILASLDAMILLDLRKGREAQQEVSGQQRPVVEVDLTLVLPAVGGYEPAAFQKKFQNIQNRLDKN